ncbi:hypothetical protein M9H77_20312 [Catharanthus roseus]|uniref:Uncharacterized protein n=1 Tax=Catharanthus roseus TaxID=4058 RepID=A0ACC0ALG3_CATRO|nr:hypothetical protein M9H77_20312 [Catharanthus roseus]
MWALKDGLKFQANFIKCGFTPSIVTINQLIHLYSKNGFVEEANKLFDEMPDRNVYTWNAIINAHTKAQNFSKAQNLFDAAPSKDSVTYNLMISGYANDEGCEEDKAVNLFLQMQHEGEKARPDEFTLTTMLNLVAKLRFLSWGRQLHGLMVKTGNNQSQFSLSSLIDMYSKCRTFHDVMRVYDGGPCVFDLVSKNAMVAACCREGELDMAEKLFWHKPEINDVVSWNTMIAGYVQNGHEEAALDMFKCMAVKGLKWNQHTLASILSACSSLKSLKMGKQAHAWILKEGIMNNPFISSGVIEVYSKCGDMKDAKNVYKEIMPQNSFAISSMIVGYSAKGYMTEARRLFDSVTEKNSVILTAMISGFVKSNQSEEAFELFSKFVEKNAENLDALMFINLLGACTIQATIDPGKQIHAYLFRIGIEMDEVLISALVDMYAKCGNIKYAKQVFYSATSRDLVLYNVMIAGYAHHGHEYEAYQLFEEMLKRGLRPDGVTFIAILSACRHRGLVDAGEKYFSSMTEDYAISPESDHYACMIDLYGRANQLEKAIIFMERIPIQPDAVILGSFLNACKMNRNVELAKATEDKLLQIEGDNGARYVQLASLYASEGKWDEKGRIMKKMRGNEAKKLTGCSWVHIGNRLHTFTSSDRSHSETEALYATLKCLIQGLQVNMPIEIEFL